MSYVPLSQGNDLRNILSGAHLGYLAKVGDDAAVILRAHLMAEECLNLWVRKTTDCSEIFDRGMFQFRTKLDLARNLGLPEKISVAFERLNKIRNRFAHRLDAASIQQGELEAFKNSVEAIETKPALGEWGDHIDAGIPKDGVLLKYSAPDTDDRQKVSIIMDVLMGKIFLVYQEEFKIRNIPLQL